ncbi:ATP-dependent nuclease [Peribacillus simplex]|uniref:ATP-dependent nuclease n=1 Tax=Peribacillus simplex TaxID=1478 RepID=UPI003CFDD4E0
MYFIEGFYIEGYRSFKSKMHKGIKVENLNNFNLFIGPNNSGKSNIMRFFMQVNRQLKKKPGRFQTKDFHKHEEKSKIFAEIDISSQGKNEKATLMVNEHKEFLHDWLSSNSLDQLFRNHIYFIGTNRDHSSTTEVNEYDFLSPSEIKGMWSLLNYDGFKTLMNGWLTDILEEEVEVHFDDDEPENIIIKIAGIPYELADLGSGVEQILQILTNLYYRDSDTIGGRNIFIEEPEVHLHPRVHVKFIELIQKDTLLKKHRYFIFSHSNALLDCIDDNWSVYWVWKDKTEGITEVTQCDQRDGTYDILDSIGVKPSQLMQSNLVIWVEGPSDRIYINKWIDLLTAEKGRRYEEGKHYSFLMYGGSLLGHYGVFDKGNKNNENDENDGIRDEEEQELVDIFSTSRYAVVVIDRDREDQDSPLKKRVEKLETAIDNRERKDRVKLWITSGREIENYISHETLSEVCMTFKKEYILYENKRVDFEEPNIKNLPAVSFSTKHSFDEYFAELFLSSELLSKYPEEKFKEVAVKKISKIFNKIFVAKRVVKKLDSNEYLSVKLKEDIKPLLSLIEKANGF